MVYEGGAVKLVVSDILGNESSVSSTSIQSNVWQNWQGTYDGHDLKIYLEGKLNQSQTINLNIGYDDTYPLLLGSYMGGTLSFDGNLDDFSFFKEALTPAGLMTIHQAQSPSLAGSYTSNLMATANSQPWLNLNWITTLPFFKELPDYKSGSAQNETSVNYSSLVGSNGNVGDNNLMNGIVGLWHLNEVSGYLITDSSGTNNNGNLNGTATLGKAGVFKSAALFDGSGTSYIDIPNSPTLDNLRSNISVSVWVNPSAQGGWIFSRRTGCVSEGFSITTAYISTQVGSFPIAVPLNSWSHILVTYNGSNLIAYVNGAVAGSTPASGSISTGLKNRLGVREATGECDYPMPYSGLMDEVAIWSRALVPTEAQQLYRRGSNRIKYQIRTCNTNPCSVSDNWVGIDGTAQSFISEIDNSGPASPIINLVSPQAKPYFQYQAVFESDQILTPELKSVSGLPSHYDASSPSVTTKEGFLFYRLSDINVNQSYCDGATYSLGVGTSYENAKWYWWNQATWKLSDGTKLQSNLIEAVKANISSLSDISQNGLLFVKVYFNSDGAKGCLIKSIQVKGLKSKE